MDMLSNFDRAVNFIFKLENVLDKDGNVIWENVSDDKGGLTKYGIDQTSHPQVDIKHLTEEQAKGIYREAYWNKIRGDAFDWPLCLVVFDIAVNNGVGRAARWLQEVCNVAIDGYIGPITTKSANQFPVETAKELLLKRESKYYKWAEQPGQKQFLKGWLNRNSKVRGALNG